MREDIKKLLNEYRETEKCLNMGLEWLPENDSAKSKIDVIHVIIDDLEKILEK